MTDLQKNYDVAILRYIQAFEKKQGYRFETWVDKNHIADFGMTFLLVFDIIFDIDNNCPVGQIFRWYEAELEARYANLSPINYRSWNMGAKDELRHKITL